MLTEENRKDLEVKGVTVVPNVVSAEDCDRHQAFFTEWLKSFGEGKWPQSYHSLIQAYSAGHLKPAWEVRLDSRKVFAQLWGTEKLLCSTDAIAIGRPPEDGQEPFWSPQTGWIHVDQQADRVGLHAFQGAVYLEETAEDDWTFEVVEGSHLLFEELTERSNLYHHRRLKPEDLAWMEERGCRRRRIPCPKGGMVLWDSRTFHANAHPLQGRNNPGRWRYVVFVCMAPAAWAGPDDLEAKRRAYENMSITHHWPSDGIVTFFPVIKPGQPQGPKEPPVLPEVATSNAAKRLVGILPYDEDGGEDCKSNGFIPIVPLDFKPIWDKERWAKERAEAKK